MIIPILPINPEERRKAIVDLVKGKKVKFTVAGIDYVTVPRQSLNLNVKNIIN